MSYSFIDSHVLKTTVTELETSAEALLSRLMKDENPSPIDYRWIRDKAHWFELYKRIVVLSPEHRIRYFARYCIYVSFVDRNLDLM